MRITLSPRDSERWLAGDPDAWHVEENVLTWAESQVPPLREPVVVILDDGRTAFAFMVERDGGEQ